MSKPLCTGIPVFAVRVDGVVWKRRLESEPRPRTVTTHEYELVAKTTGGLSKREGRLSNILLESVFYHVAIPTKVRTPAGRHRARAAPVATVPTSQPFFSPSTLYAKSEKSFENGIMTLPS